METVLIRKVSSLNAELFISASLLAGFTIALIYAEWWLLKIFYEMVEIE